MKVTRKTVYEVDNSVFIGSTAVLFKTGGENKDHLSLYAQAVSVYDGPVGERGVLLFVPCVDIESFTNLPDTNKG